MVPRPTLLALLCVTLACGLDVKSSEIPNSDDQVLVQKKDGEHATQTTKGQIYDTYATVVFAGLVLQHFFTWLLVDKAVEVDLDFIINLIFGANWMLGFPAIYYAYSLDNPGFLPNIRWCMADFENPRHAAIAHIWVLSSGWMLMEKFQNFWAFVHWDLFWFSQSIIGYFEHQKGENFSMALDIAIRVGNGLHLACMTALVLSDNVPVAALAFGVVGLFVASEIPVALVAHTAGVGPGFANIFFQQAILLSGGIFFLVPGAGGRIKTIPDFITNQIAAAQYSADPDQGE